MKNKLTILPIPKNRRHLGELFDAMKKQGVDIKPGESLDEIIVETRHQDTAEKILNIHGFQITKENNLVGAMNKLAEQFDFGQPRPREEQPSREAQINKSWLVRFAQRKARAARAARSKSRSQHGRDKLDGQIAAYEDILRYLKKH